MRVDHAGLFLCFNEGQLSKIIDKFKKAAEAKEALRQAEKETIL